MQLLRRHQHIESDHLDVELREVDDIPLYHQRSEVNPEVLLYEEQLVESQTLILTGQIVVRRNNDVMQAHCMHVVLDLGELTEYLHFSADLLGFVAAIKHVFDVFDGVEEASVLVYGEVDLAV